MKECPRAFGPRFVRASAYVALTLAMARVGVACDPARAAEAPPLAPDDGGPAESLIAPAAAARTAIDGADASANWQATELTADGVALGEFAVVSPPDAAHPRGVIAALAYPNDDEREPQPIFVVSFDVATLHELRRIEVGHDWRKVGFVEITGTAGGVAVAMQKETALDVIWLDGALVVTARHSLPGLGFASKYDFRGFTGLGDRLVLVDRDDTTLGIRVLDGRGAVVSRHTCHGTPLGTAHFEHTGDAVVLTNLFYDKNGQKPVCSLQLHGRPSWHEAKLPDDGDIWVIDGGALQYTWYDPPVGPHARILGPDLTLSKEDTEGAPPGWPDCSGVTGTAIDEIESVGGRSIQHTHSCCGDRTHAGLFVCRPPGFTE